MGGEGEEGVTQDLASVWLGCARLHVSEGLRGVEV